MIKLSKRRYTRKEVYYLLEKTEEEYSDTVNGMKVKYQELVEENKKLLASNLLYKNNDENVSNALKLADEKAKDYESDLNSKYELEVERLKAFGKKFYKYFEYLNQKYPYYPSIKEEKEFSENLFSLIGKKPNKEIIESVEAELNVKLSEGEKDVFNPKAKIMDYISSTENNGFDINEVLNPGELKLEDICKELGLTDEE